MWAGIIFVLVAITLLLLAALLNGSIRRARLRKRDRAPQRPTVGWGNDTSLPRL